MITVTNTKLIPKQCLHRITDITELKLIRKQYGRVKLQTLQTLQILQFLLKITLAGSWSVVRGAHIQAFTFLLVKGTLKITVGCPPCTCPSICAEITLCGHHLRPSPFPTSPQKTPFFVTVWEAWAGHRRVDMCLGRQTGHTGERTCVWEVGQDTYDGGYVGYVFFFLKKNRINVVWRRTPSVERCSVSSWTWEVQTPELAACQSATALAARLAWARRLRRLSTLPCPIPADLPQPVLA